MKVHLKANSNKTINLAPKMCVRVCTGVHSRPDTVQWVLLSDDERTAESFHVYNSVLVVD